MQQHQSQFGHFYITPVALRELFYVPSPPGPHPTEMTIVLPVNKSSPKKINK